MIKKVLTFNFLLFSKTRSPNKSLPIPGFILILLANFIFLSQVVFYHSYYITEVVLFFLLGQIDLYRFGNDKVLDSSYFIIAPISSNQKYALYFLSEVLSVKLLVLAAVFAAAIFANLNPLSVLLTLGALYLLYNSLISPILILSSRKGSIAVILKIGLIAFPLFLFTLVGGFIFQIVVEHNKVLSILEAKLSSYFTVKILLSLILSACFYCLFRSVINRLIMKKPFRDNSIVNNFFKKL